MKLCAVIGSINMDISVATPRVPEAGETLTGDSLHISPGGKGANQAVALAKLGVPVRMAGRVGDDAFGQDYMRHFTSCGVDTRAVETAAGESTGAASIMVSGDGENRIVVVPGANLGCDESWLARTLEPIMDCDIFLLQLEIPLNTVTACAQALRRAGKTVILDPAPAVPLSGELLSSVDFVTPNETELRILTGEMDEGAGMEERVRALSRFGCQVIHKRGADGAFIGTGDGIVHMPGHRVKVVDTTAAGDTFNAGFAAGMAMGWSVEDSVRLANAAGALAVTAFGAQGGMPGMDAARRLMDEKM